MPQVVNGALIRTATTGFRALFQGGLSQAKPKHVPYVVEVPSVGSGEKHLFGGGIPGMSEWKGQRTIHSLSLHQISVDNTTYELTLGIPRDAFEDDSYGLFRPQVEMMGMRAALHPTELWADLLAKGFTTTKSYDNVAMCATTHPRLSGGTQSNKGTAVLSADAFAAGITALRKLTDERAAPLGLVDTCRLHLVVPPELEATARGILQVELTANGGTNINYNRADLVIEERLSATSTTAWFLLMTGLPLRPFILQMRRKPTLVAKDQPADDNVFFEREVIYGVDGRWAVAPGLWQLAYGSTGA